MGISYFLLCNLLRNRNGIEIDVPAEENSPKLHAIRFQHHGVMEAGVLYLRAQGTQSELVGKDISPIIVSCSYEVLHDAISALFEELSDWNRRMQNASWKPDAIAEIIAIACEHIPHPMYAADPGYRIYAMSDHPDMCQMSSGWKYAYEQGYLPLDTISNLYRSGELRKSKYRNRAVITTSDSFYSRFTNYLIKEGDTIFGHYFVLEYFKNIESFEIELIQMVGDAIRQVFINNTQFYVTSGSMYEHFVLDVLEGTLSKKSLIEKQLRALGFAEEGSFLLLRIEPGQHDALMLRSICNALEKKIADTLAVVHKQGITAVCQCSAVRSWEDILPQLESFLKDAKLEVGVSDAFEEFTDMPLAYYQTDAALTYAKQKNVSRIVHFEDISLRHFVSQSARYLELDRYVHPGLAKLAIYDRENETQLVDTLRCYVENDRRAKETAAQLYVHRNTLTKRLEKIVSVGAIDLEAYETIRRLMLSFEIINVLADTSLPSTEERAPS